MRILVTGGARLHRHPPVPPPARRRTRRLRGRQRVQRAPREPARRCPLHRAETSRAPADVEPVFAARLDAVCHIAGQVSIIRSFSDPIADLRTNVEGTLNVLQLCLKYKVPRLIYASSMTLYGDCGTVPTPESEPCRPNSYYGITKFAAERYVHATAERPDLGFDFARHLAAHVQRLRSGPGVQQSLSGRASASSRATCCAASRSPSSATASRRAISSTSTTSSRAGCGRSTTPRRAAAVINLGSGRSLSINELAERRRSRHSAAGRRHQIVRAPARPGEQRSRARRHRPRRIAARLGAAHAVRGGARRDRALGPRRVRRSRRRAAGRPPR